MAPGMALLLGLGSPSQPSIWAEPGAVTPNGSSVSIFCRVPPGVTRLYLFRGEPSDMWHDISSEGAQDVVEFLLQNVVHTNAGTYHCVYWEREVWVGFSESLELTVTDSLAEGGTYTCYVSHRTYSCLWSLPSDPLDLSFTGSSSQPCIWAVPGAVIPHGRPVSIFCRGPPGTTSLRLHQSKPRGEPYDRHLEGGQEMVEFSLQGVTQAMAGVYYCHYWKKEIWSECTESLELMVTVCCEFLLTFSALAQAMRKVASGGNVTLLCHSLYLYDSYLLCRGGGASFPQACSRQQHSSFLISPVSLGQAGTYMCYGSLDLSSYLWTLPSDPLVVSVTCPAHPTVIVVSSTAAAFLLLVLLLLLLCLCRRRAKRSMSRVQGPSGEGILEDLEPEADGQRDTQVSMAEDPREVTYAQLWPEGLRESAAPLPSCEPEEPSTQPCVYATFTLS
ncbi:Killer cell immunoglobulin-like receptor 3DL1 [Heterocephalus glaber]|nr:Killer cell immunoglobulin-like receptor 3DL1 [Heterocephalus glaber]